ncbi:hypothetical protein [Limisalsivibrio acetivorans]|uniref:hypothetical protein n=1 Tax=Limisalsivibrio acetivorans TaxID=1304888 RepID=UPI0003B70967|nr:hypothetical protein [Limisalsivibrio acetivorans]
MTKKSEKVSDAKRDFKNTLKIGQLSTLEQVRRASAKAIKEACAGNFSFEYAYKLVNMLRTHKELINAEREEKDAQADRGVSKLQEQINKRLDELIVEENTRRAEQGLPVMTDIEEETFKFQNEPTVKYELTKH